MAKYRVEILDKNLVPLSDVRVLVPLDTQGNTIEYMRKLSDYGFARIRVATKDPMLTNLGDILQPYANHLRIYRNGVNVWQGVIVDNPKRTKNYIEVKAYGYLFLLSKVLIRHDTAINGGPGDDVRIFKSGTMANVVRTLITEAKADAGANVLSYMTAGSLENPVFPANFTSGTTSIAGQQWTFSDSLQLQFDFQSVLYVLQGLAQYSNSDFELDLQYVNGNPTLVFNFKTFLGTRRPEMAFEYSVYGGIDDYNAPRSGKNMANYLVGVAADNAGTVLKLPLSNDASILANGKVAGVAAFGDVKNANLLRSRLVEELRYVSTSDGPLDLILNDRAFDLGTYTVGDIVTAIVKDHTISVHRQVRIVGIDVRVHSTGKDTIRLITNEPRPGQ